MNLGESLFYYGMRLWHFAYKTRKPQANLNELGTSAIKNIVLMSTTALGDALLSTPAMRAMRKTYPQAKITLLLNPAYLPLFKNHADIDDIIPYAGKTKNFIKTLCQLRKIRPDLICILHANEPQATPLAALSGARFIFKIPNTSRFRFLLTNNQAEKRWDDFKHGMDQRLAVAKLAGASVDKSIDSANAYQMSIPLRAEEVKEVDQLLEKQGILPNMPLIAFQTGASTTSRRWSADNFIALGCALLSRHQNIALLLTGSPAEAALCTTIAEAILREFPARIVVTSAGKTPLRLLPALIKRAAVLVTGDTGPMHLAFTVGTKTVGLFAVSDAQKSGPAYDLDKHIVIQKQRTCEPCLSKRCPYPEPICMKNISVEEVLESVEKSLSLPPNPLSLRERVARSDG